MMAKRRGKPKIQEEFEENALSSIKNDIIAAMKSEITDLKKIMSRVEAENTQLRMTIKRVESENNQIKSDLNLLREANNNLEQYSRRNSIRIFGISEKRNESDRESERIVIDLCKEQLQIDVKRDDIDAIHRTGKIRKDKPRGIIVKFNRRKARDAVLQKRRLLKGTGIIIKEDLTPTNLQRLNLLQNRPGIQNAWTVNGKIFILTDQGEKLQVKGDSTHFKTTTVSSHDYLQFDDSLQITSTPTVREVNLKPPTNTKRSEKNLSSTEYAGNRSKNTSSSCPGVTYSSIHHGSGQKTPTSSSSETFLKTPAYQRGKRSTTSYRGQQQGNTKTGTH